MNKSVARPRFLPVLILALAVIALLRAGNVWVGFNSATAETVSEPISESEVKTAPMSDAAPLKESPSEVERRLLDQLAARRDELDRREAELDTREKLLTSVEIKIDERIQTLEVETESLRTLLAERQKIESEEYDALSSAYERMKPRDAARIFEVLDDEILVPVAAGMRTQAISGVLAEMNPEKARALTRKLANRSSTLTPADQ